MALCPDRSAPEVREDSCRGEIGESRRAGGAGSVPTRTLLAVCANMSESLSDTDPAVDPLGETAAGERATEGAAEALLEREFSFPEALARTLPPREAGGANCTAQAGAPPCALSTHISACAVELDPTVRRS